MLAEVTYNIANSLLFVVPFAYLDKKHVHIFIDNKEINSYIWQTNTSILLEELSGKKLLIKRNTPLSDYSFRFIEATALTAEVLNIIYLQHLYVLEELNDLIAKTISNPELIGNLKLQIDKLKAQEKAVNDNIKKIKELIQNTNKNIADKIRDNNKIVSKVNDLLKKVSDTLKEIKKIHGDITSKNIYPLKIFNADSTKHIVIAPDEAISKNYNLTLPEDAPKDTEFLQYDASKSSFVWAKPTEEKKEFIELNSKSGHQVRIYPAANLQKDMKINLGDDVFKLCSSIDKTTENKLTAEINTNKKDISDLETSIINEVKELTGVDDGLRNDVDINTAAIVNLKQNKAEIATQDEANNGNDDSKIVTPKKLKVITDNLIKDRATLEASIRAKLTQLDGVDSDLRKDTDGNTSDIAQLKATETADIKGVIDKITKLTATDTGGVATLTKAISDLAKKEKSDIAGIKTQQQTNTTAINDLKNKTVTLIDASESTKGVAEIATQDETNDGNDDSRIVTPKKLKVVTSDLDSRATRIRNDVDKNTADLVTHRTDIQQNTTDIVSNTASIATIITTIKKGITTDKLAKSFTVPSVLHDKIEVKGEDKDGHYGYAVAMHNDYLAISDPVLQEVVIYHRDKNNKKIFNLEDIHKGKKHGGIFVEGDQVYAKRKDGKYLDVFEYDENQTNLTFKKVNTINLSLSYGNSLAINGDYLIVGNPHSKTALIYKHSGIQWQLVEKLSGGASFQWQLVEKLSGGASFGSSVAVNYKYVLVSEVANKKAEVYKISRGFDFNAERVTGRFKVKSDGYVNAPAASTAGFLGYTVADDDGVNYSQIAQNLDDNAVYVRHFSDVNNGAWSSSDIAAFKQKTNLKTRSNENDYVQRYYSTNQVNSKLMVGFCFQQHDAGVTDYNFTGYLFIEVETNKIYYYCYDNGTLDWANSWLTEISDKLKIDEFKKMMSFTNRVLPYVLSTTVEAVNSFKATITAQGKAGSGSSDINSFITLEENNVKKSFQFTVDDEAAVYLNTKTGGAWSGWSNIAGTRPADPIQLEVAPPPAIKHFKTLTGGASYSKVIDLNAELSAFAQPNNNILKIYKNLAEIASKTVKADCVSVGTGIVLATSKTDKKAYLYDFFSKTGWFTTTKTKWAGLPDNAKGYTGYNITGGHYQLVRPVGTTDTYTKYRDGAWVKNGNWGGVLFYDATKIGLKMEETKTNISKGEFERIRADKGVKIPKTHPLALAWENNIRGKSIDIRKVITDMELWISSNSAFASGSMSAAVQFGSDRYINHLSYKKLSIDTSEQYSSLFLCFAFRESKVLFIDLFTKGAGTYDNVAIKQTRIYDKTTTASVLRANRDTLEPFKNNSYKRNPLGLTIFIPGSDIIGFETSGVPAYNIIYYPDAYIRGYKFYRLSVKKQLCIETKDGKHYYNNKEVKDSAKFNSIMETVAPLLALPPNPIVQTNRNIKFTLDDMQEQPNKTGNYVSLLGTGTATTPVDITKSDTNFTIDTNYGDACAITKDKVLITNKTDSKLAIYDHKGAKEKEIQLEAGVGSVIDATDTEAVVGSETANTVDIVSLT